MNECTIPCGRDSTLNVYPGLNSFGSLCGFVDGFDYDKFVAGIFHYYAKLRAEKMYSKVVSLEQSRFHIDFTNHD